MTKTYKLWIEIEEIDEEADTYRDVTGEGIDAEPVPLNTYATLKDAVTAAEALGFATCPHFARSERRMRPMKQEGE